MSVNAIHIIPDYENLDYYLELTQKHGMHFEYNDFFDTDLVDDKEECNKRINVYKALTRDRSQDTLHGAFYDLCVNSMDRQIAGFSRKRMRESMDIAARLGVKGVVFHTNLIAGFNNESYLSRWQEINGSFLQELLREYKGMEIYIENMFDQSPNVLCKLAASMHADMHESSFGVCFDVAHCHITSVSMEEWFRQLSPYIKHMHINDNDGISDLHNAVGDGSIDWQQFNSLMRQFDIEASVLIEVRGKEKLERSLGYMMEKGICLSDETNRSRRGAAD